MSDQRLMPTTFRTQNRNKRWCAAHRRLNRNNLSRRELFLPLLLSLLLWSIPAIAQNPSRAGSIAAPAPPPPPRKSADGNNSSAGLLPQRHETEAAELKSTLATLENQNLRDWLKKIIAERREFDVTNEQRQEWGRQLPYRLNDFVDQPKSQKLAHVAGKVFEMFKAPNRELLVYRSEKPLIMTWKGYYVLLSAAIADDFTDAEIAGLVAHEAAHLVFTDQLRRAFEERDESAARTIELQCDAAAIIALDLLDLPAGAYISALEKMTGARKRFNIDDDLDPLHPTLAVRQALSRRLLKRLRARPRRSQFLQKGRRESRFSRRG